MGLSQYSFLLVLFLLCLALLWRLSGLPLQPSHSPAGRRRSPLHRLLKLRWSLAPVKKGRSGLLHGKKPVRNGFAEVDRIIPRIR